MTAPILIVGAGPTGLNLALRLRRHGEAFRIIDRDLGPARESRALAVHARTLEFYRQLGLADAAVAAGTRIRTVHLLSRGEEVARLPLGDMGEGLSPYPFLLDLPQDEHERFLVDALARDGVEVEWSTELTALEQERDGVEVALRKGAEVEHARFGWVCGCDGARSPVRRALGVAFEGAAYRHRYYVADVRLADDAGDDAFIVMGDGAFGLRMPSRRGAMQRLVGFAPPSVPGREPSFDDVRAEVEALMRVRVAAVNWYSTYGVDHRVAARFRVGRCFLLGDAGHVHSPVGGQGMNTGIGDAVNLSWKLAHLVAGRAPPALLDSYEPERIAFARLLVSTTDRAFAFVTATGITGRLFRTAVLPHLVPFVTGFRAGRRIAFRTVSQTRISYRDSPVAEGKAGRVAGGDRLPWVADLDNFAPLASLDWQLHVYGEPDAALADAADELGLPLHIFGYSSAARAAGLRRDAAYLIRPDGHIGLAAVDRRAERLRGYVARHRLHG